MGPCPGGPTVLKVRTSLCRYHSDHVEWSCLKIRMEAIGVCASCEQEPGVVSYDGATLCARCGSQREWASVIALIQRGLASPAPQRDSASSSPEAVGADPFAVA